MIAVDAGDPIYCADTNVLDEAVDGLMMLMCLPLLRDCCYDKWYDDAGIHVNLWNGCVSF